MKGVVIGSLALMGMIFAGAVRAPDAPGDEESDVRRVTDKARMMLETDRDMATVLAALDDLKPRPIAKLSPEQARKQPTLADAVVSVLAEAGRDTAPSALVPGVGTREIEVDGAAGKLPATIYTPAGSGNFPVVLYFHGGGWVIADRKTYDAGARGLAREARAIVVSVDYRRAPEHNFPAAHDDAVASYRWVTDNATTFGGDPNRVALAGESAGGTLALATAIAARDKKLQAPMHVLAVYPVAQPATNTASYLEYAQAKPLNRAMMLWFAGHYTRGPADMRDPRIDLAHARLDNLPPVTLVNAEIDPLATDGLILETKLREAGVPVERRVYEGVAHEFFGAAAVVKDAQAAQQWAGQRLAMAFGDPSKGPKPTPPTASP